MSYQQEIVGVEGCFLLARPVCVWV